MPPPIAASNPSAIRSTCRLSNCQSGRTCGIAFQEFRQQRQDVFDAERQAHADLEHAGRLAAIRGNARDRRLQFVQIAADREQEALAGFGQRQLPGAALKQPDAEIALQHRDVAAHRGRGERQPPRGGRKAACFGASDEGFEVRERFHGHLQVMLESNYSHYRLITQQ